MDIDADQVIDGLGALAQPTRLAAFRHIVSRQPEGIAAGELAALLAVPQNTLSAHLSILARAGLVTGERHGRSIIYRADLTRLGALMLFLIQDCCGGRRELCAPLTNALPSCEPKGASMTKTFNVLFLCTGNTARSILAESILRKDGVGRFNAFSAGSQPKGTVNPHALKTLAAFGYPTDGFRSKSWEEFSGADAPQMDFIFTVCDSAAGESCPVWPGHPMTAHWGIEDPAAVEGSEIDKDRAFTDAFRFMRARIAAFTALPVASLDRLALQQRLKQIGGLEGASVAGGA